jgi:hypothetical protein
MKVSTPTKVYNNGDKMTPPLPLKAELPSEEDETRLAKFKLRVTPSNADSATYSFATRKLDGTEHLRYALNFHRDCKKILVGLHITDAAASIRVIRELLTGIGLSQFNTGIDDHVNEMFATNKQDAYDTSFVSKTIRKELHAFNKKRKVDTNDDKPTDDDQSVNNFELTDVDLSKMDFSKDSDIDDEFSV